MTQIRPILGDFSSAVCFKAVITGVEDTLGPDGAAVAFTRAGRVRGQQLARDLGLSGSALSDQELATQLDAALGQHGTRLCAVHALTRDGERLIVDTQETVCSAGEPQGSDRKCTFTLGAVQGALEEATGQMLMAEHTDSVLRGSQYDRFEFTPL